MAKQNKQKDKEILKIYFVSKKDGSGDGELKLEIDGENLTENISLFGLEPILITIAQINHVVIEMNNALSVIEASRSEDDDEEEDYDIDNNIIPMNFQNNASA